MCMRICFHVLAVNNAAVNMGIVSLWYTDFIKCEFAGSYDSSIYNLGDITVLVSVAAVPMYVSWNMQRLPLSLHRQKHWLSCVFLIIAVFTGVMWHLIFWCWFAFSWWLEMLSIFSCTIGHFCVLFGKMPIGSLLILKFWVFSFFIEIYEFLIYFRY